MDVLAFRRGLGVQVVEVLAAIDVGWRAVFLPRGPGDDSGLRRLGGAMRRDPFQNLAVTLAGGQFRLQGFVVDASELEEALIQRAIVMILTSLADKGRAAFVQQTGEDNVATEPHARAARRTLCKVDIAHAARSIAQITIGATDMKAGR